MNLNVDQRFRTMRPDDPEHEFIREKKEKTEKDLTLADVCIGALLGPGPRCPRCGTAQFPIVPVDGKEVLRRWQLAQKIDAADGTIAVSNDQITLLKELITKNWPVIVVGQAFEMLDPVGAAQAREEEKEKLEKETTKETKG